MSARSPKLQQRRSEKIRKANGRESRTRYVKRQQDA